MALILFPRAGDSVDPSVVQAGTDQGALEGALLAYPSLGATFGAYLMGTFFGLMLYGFSVHQTYRYVRLFPNDTLFIRSLVGAVMSLETVHAIFTMHTCYHYLTANYNNPVVLNLGVWSINYIPIIIAVNMMLSQLFFARRVWLMGKVYRIIVAVALLWFGVEIGFSIAAVLKVIAVSDFHAVSKVNHLLAATFGAAFIGDSLLTGSLIAVLRRNRNSEYRQDESPFDTMLMYMINTGLLHAILNALSFVIVLALPDDLVHGSISIITTRLYGNTLLAVLNSRKFNVITRGIEAIEGEAVGMNQIIARANRLAKQERWNVPEVRLRPRYLVPEPSPPVIKVQVTTEMGDDGHKYEKSLREPEPSRRGTRASARSMLNFITID
ncbi:hypothetical protein C8Q76DRAFT_79526 [Earliella scabrosa]|nr:hypothetical protein C8Q76DRAFT_79526 [Earliella scabrosa]